MRPSATVIYRLILGNRRGMSKSRSSRRSEAAIALQNMIDMSRVLRRMSPDLNMLSGWHSGVDIES